jgi:hypothetical protein
LQLSAASQCWICEGWTQVKFEFQSDVQPVRLHLEVDQYEGWTMVPAKPGFFEFYRMLPPGTHKYYFSVNGVQQVAKETQTAEAMHTPKLVEPLTVKTSKALANP